MVKSRIIKMQIWVDICHTPHALMLTPLIREFYNQGHAVQVTVRDYFQIRELLHLKYKIIGRHYGGNKFLKIYGIIRRTLQLVNYARSFNFSFSLSAGSPYQALASHILNIPHFMINDYEHSSVFKIVRYTKSTFFFPVYISDGSLSAKGIPLHNVIKFPGLKEAIYLENFAPDSNNGIYSPEQTRKIIVVLRPPATRAHYHNTQSDFLMGHILKLLQTQDNVTTILIPRDENQRVQYKSGNLIIPDHAIDTLSLLYYADVMIGGGGTMNREAAALGVPTYSFFCGPIGDVDRYLQATGKLTFIKTVEDIAKIKLEKRQNRGRNLSEIPRVKKFIVEQILKSINNKNS